jgi:hypothetical protein
VTKGFEFGTQFLKILLVTHPLYMGDCIFVKSAVNSPRTISTFSFELITFPVFLDACFTLEKMQFLTAEHSIKKHHTTKSIKRAQAPNNSN